MFKKFINSSYIALLHHPLGVIFYLFFWFFIAFFHNLYQCSDFLFLTLFVIFCETFFKAKENLTQTYKSITNFWILFFGLTFYIILHFIFKQDEDYLLFYTQNTLYVSLALTLIALVCARKLYDFNYFHHFLAALSFSVSFWLIFGIFLAIFYGSFNFLFDISSSKLNSHVLSLWLFSAGIFSLFLLGKFTSYSFNKIFIFILNTFSILYIIMLFAYGLGVLFNLLESLSIVHLCLWFGIFLLINLWINLSFYKIKKSLLYAFFIVLLSLNIFVFYAIIVRIIQYGFTPERLAVLTLNLWLLIANYLSVFRQKIALKFSFYLLALMALFLGFFANHITIFSQKYQLQKIENSIYSLDLNYTQSKQYYNQIKNIKNTLHDLDKNYNNNYSFDDFLKTYNLTHLKPQKIEFHNMSKKFHPKYHKLKDNYDEVLFDFIANTSDFKYFMRIDNNTLYFLLQEKELLKLENFDKILKNYQKNSQLNYKLNNGSSLIFIPLEFNINIKGEITFFKTHVFIKNSK
ncbi:DUF4153 domain-containing protein [Campylobacter peloridis]|uniref:DUF4153 domain-containing protein n=1 Tax=Campylobacter peloridis TaxID=488546 RepID=A0ABX6TR58_9BACT|nr:DUF4153 domain-containing protein [Campylobacter peloridis]AJC84296.1 hypothetical membrane protein (DUF4153 domain) [Campylobacter peloridis LMG 23910]QOQ88398.1 DUF4153 domain-containing protein [Campylobacter peloridis]